MTERISDIKAITLAFLTVGCFATIIITIGSSEDYGEFFTKEATLFWIIVVAFICLLTYTLKIGGMKENG